MKRIIARLSVGEDGALVDELGLPALERPGDPLEAARALAAAGVDGISFSGHGAPLEVLSALSRRVTPLLTVPLHVEVNARTAAQVASLLEAGTALVVIEAAALRDPDFLASLAREFGSESIAVTVSAASEDEGWRVLESAGGPPTEWDAVTWACVVESQGAGAIVVQSAMRRARDARGSPFDLELISAVGSAVDLPTVAAGEAQIVEDLFDVMMVGDADGVLEGSLFQSGRATVRQAKSYLREHGLAVGGSE
ncbi:MAG: hypothetical protein AMS21_03175 [Gemmatimonas sp. SG8_38_2]|nr:MAG: hypothetical protein AMS21_03175 [Gemmatimonas sp. SG8_38_2]